MSSASDGRRPIVVRRKRATSHQHLGNWKIAYADFMTAMMAFFLVMWLVSGFSKAELQSVSEYFRTPLNVALMGGDKASASDSPIPGGGDDPVHADGQEHQTEPKARNYSPNRASHHRAVRQNSSMSTDKVLEGLKKQLNTLIRKTPALRSLNSQISIQIVPRGLIVQIFDEPRRPMFALGSANLAPYIENLLAKIAPVLNTVENKVMLIGHTDSIPYLSKPGQYSNWELSSDRANAARRALVTGGMWPDKVLRVIGAAATSKVPDQKPKAPVNRRISILILNDKAQARIEAENKVRKGPPSGKSSKEQGGEKSFPYPMTKGSMESWLELSGYRGAHIDFRLSSGQGHRVAMKAFEGQWMTGGKG